MLAFLQSPAQDMTYEDMERFYRQRTSQADNLTASSSNAGLTL